MCPANDKRVSHLTLSEELVNVYIILRCLDIFDVHCILKWLTLPLNTISFLTVNLFRKSSCYKNA